MKLIKGCSANTDYWQYMFVAKHKGRMWGKYYYFDVYNKWLF